MILPLRGTIGTSGLGGIEIGPLLISRGVNVRFDHMVELP
jgi:hypothetical protein